MEYEICPPPEQVSHDSQPGICSILPIVVPVGFAGPGEGAGGAGFVGTVGGAVLPAVLPEDGGGGFCADGVTGEVTEAVGGKEAEPPHPVMALTRSPRTTRAMIRGGTGDISQF